MRRVALARSLLLGILSLFAFVAPAAAGDFRGTQNVTVADGETVDDDLYVGAGRCRSPARSRATRPSAQER